jgi:hypothetical protein
MVLFSTKIANMESDESSVVMVGNLPVLHLADLQNDTYDVLSEKVFLTLKYVYRHYSDYDWYLKADENTFVFIDHLQSFLKQSESEDKPLIHGYTFQIYKYKSG